MTKRRVLLVFACLLMAAHSSAFKLEEPPSPAVGLGAGAEGTSAGRANYSVTLDKENWSNIYVGHYGEVLRLFSDSTAEAEMHGLVEVVRFHEKTTDPHKLSAPPFQPKPEDYVPENFTRLRLMQLLVIPKNAPGGYRSLKKLRQAKEKELAASGVGYKLHPKIYDWPKDTFWVLVSTPYGLLQYYTQSDKNFFILTTGESSTDPQVGSAATRLSDSLNKYLQPFQRRLTEAHLIYKNPYIMGPWALICVIGGLLGFLPKRGWLWRLRRIGRAMIVFSTVLPLLGWPFIYVGWEYGLEHWANLGSAILCTAMVVPLASMAASSWMGSARPWRVFWWMAAINVLPAIGGAVEMLYYTSGYALDGRLAFSMMFDDLAVLAIIYAITFGLTHEEGESVGEPERAS